MLHKNHNLSYRDAGVDIDAGDALVKRITPLAKTTARAEILGGIGGFGGLFELPIERYRQPVLVSSTDGVGTKIKLAPLNTIGIDLVAMCVNDIVTSGAEPLFFLDYYATGKLNVTNAELVIKSIAEGCQQAGCTLIGGETAEMPGVYADNDYDIAGFAVGIVEKPAILGPHRVNIGDALIGIASSGPHSNGYSLIRKILNLNSNSYSQTIAPDAAILNALTAPTRIYVKPLLNLMQTIEIHALAHITGGGITENLPRILPQDTQAIINLKAWNRPAIFNWLQTNGNIAEAEMLRVFNCGIGMIVAVPKDQTNIAITQLTQLGELAFHIGQIDSAIGAPTVKYA